MRNPLTSVEYHALRQYDRSPTHDANNLDQLPAHLQERSFLEHVQTYGYRQTHRITDSGRKALAAADRYYANLHAAHMRADTGQDDTP
jgi:hypothetical protein